MSCVAALYLSSARKASRAQLFYRCREKAIGGAARVKQEQNPRTPCRKKPCFPLEPLLRPNAGRLVVSKQKTSGKSNSRSVFIQVMTSLCFNCSHGCASGPGTLCHIILRASPPLCPVSADGISNNREKKVAVTSSSWRGLLIKNQTCFVEQT